MTVSFLQNFGANSQPITACSPQCSTAICQKAPTASDSALTTPRDFSEAFDPSTLSDEELLARIKLCELQMMAAEKLGMKAERRRWYDEEARALRERWNRPAIVARLEAAQRERMALEPGGEGSVA